MLEPLHLLARIAALIPPPRYPLTRLAGVLAPHSTWRAAVVKYGRDTNTMLSVPATTPKKKSKKTKKEAGPVAALALTSAPTASSREDNDEPSSPPTSLGTGIVKPVGARIDWASLLRRIHLVDVLACPCGGRRSVLADINDPSVVTAILAHLGLPTQPPPIARARSPADAA